MTTIQKPAELDLSLIDEDPDQPRTEFNEELLQEMAKTIRARGVKNPISVHKHPTDEGRYMVNDGARRYRASKIAGKTSIPAFIDSDFTKIDQVIVNSHHESFTLREWAVIIDHEVKKGKSKAAIAAELGKSKAFVTDHSKLLALPESIAQAFNASRCLDATALSELAVIHNLDAEEVDVWLSDEKRIISRGTVRQLHAYVNNKPAEDDGEAGLREGELTGETLLKKKTKRSRIKTRKVIIQVLHDGRKARLNIEQPVSEAGVASFVYEEDGVEFDAALDQVQFVAFL